MDKIKLVIWDLDETFWNGTLSEEGVRPIDENIAVVKELCDRGIMSSIVSKNDFDDAKKKLEELGVWDYFIFPVITWNSKGKLIKSLIENCQLRDENVLFVDDNHLNLEEAKFYNPNLHIVEPDFIAEMLNHKAFIGKDDSDHTRLKQYKILEDKHTASLEFDDNVEFLRNSNIRIQRFYGFGLIDNIDRIVELIDRTNQLNFTKKRVNKKQVLELLQDEKYTASLIKVKDNFGDYGFVGFYIFDKEQHRLEQFVFSCRILNLGVTQFVYNLLGMPRIDIIPEVAEELKNDCPVDWITEIKSDQEIGVKNEKKVSSETTKLFFKGGCDLSQMVYYLVGDLEVREETNYVGQNNFPIHREHTQVVLDAYYLSDTQKARIAGKEFVPFVDENFYTKDVFSEEYDCLVYSVLMDYTQELYENEQEGIKLPFGGYFNHWSSDSNDDDLVEHFRKRNISVDVNILASFRKEFTHVGQISPINFMENLRKIRFLVPEHVPIIFINGAELESPHPFEKSAKNRHIAMNEALDSFISESNNTYLVDVRKVVVSSSQLRNNLRHYNRDVYKELSSQLLQVLNLALEKKVNANIQDKISIKGILRHNKLTSKLYKKIFRFRRFISKS